MRHLKCLGAGLILCVVVGIAFLALKRGDPEYYYGEKLNDSGLRYEVWLRKRIVGMPGDGTGGPAVVRVFDIDQKLILEEEIESALQGVSLFEDEILIDGVGTWELIQLRAD